MPAHLTYSRQFLFPVIIFWIAMVLAIVQWQWYWALIPFIWIIIPGVFCLTAKYTEQLFWLLLIFLPLSTELNITPSLGLDFPDEVFMISLTGLSLLYWWHQPVSFPKNVWKHPLFFVLLMHISWIAITTIFSTMPLFSFKFLLAKTWYIIPFVILPSVWLSSVTRVEKMVRCLLWPMAIVVAVTLIRHAASGFSFESVNWHLHPFFRNHVNYGAMLVCLSVIAAGAYVLLPQQHRLKKWIGVLILLNLAGLLFSYSRGAWIALIAGLMTVWVVSKRYMGAAIVLAIVVVLVSTVWLVTDKRYFRFAPDHDRTVFHTDFSQHMSATLQFKDVSNAERFYRWVAGARMFADKPVTGFGPSSFYLQYKPYTVNRFETWVSNNPEHSTVHNYFLLTALEQGVIGLVIFCVLYFGMLWRVQQLYHQLHNRFYQVTAMVIAVVLVMIGVINFMSDMVETDKIGSLFWLSLGMIIVLEARLTEEKSSIA